MKNKSSEHKGKKKEKSGEAKAVKLDLCDKEGMEKRVKKRRHDKNNEVAVAKDTETYNDKKDDHNEQNGADAAAEKKSTLRKKRRKNEKLKTGETGKCNELHSQVGNGFKAHKDKMVGASQFEDQGLTESAELPKDSRRGTKTRKSKKALKLDKKDGLLSKKDKYLPEWEGQAEDDVHQISSGDEDCSRGMKKWIEEYHQSRPGLEILQQRIDEFITAHETQEEQARKEREAQAAEGGWTVVVHHKGRKKTTDSESGITVGSVAPATVMDKMAKKKSKDVGLDFYRFQRREAQRNEIMMLQSKFEQDKKRIQQMRAARKFKPY